MLKIVIVCENEEKAVAARWFFRETYSLIPSGWFVTERSIDDMLTKIEAGLKIHAIIDLDGNATTRQLQELIDNEVLYFFIPDLVKLDKAKNFNSCDYTL